MQIQLAHPDASWLAKYALAGAYWPILPAHMLGSVALKDLPKNSFFKKWPVSAGPYTLTTFRPNQYAEVTRNDNWSAGKAFFKKVVFQVLSTDQMTAKLQTGEVQYIYTVDPSDVEPSEEHPGCHRRVAPGRRPRCLRLQQQAARAPGPAGAGGNAVRASIARASVRTILGGHCTTPLTNLRQIAPCLGDPDDRCDQLQLRPGEGQGAAEGGPLEPQHQAGLLGPHAAKLRRQSRDVAVTPLARNEKALFTRKSIRPHRLRASSASVWQNDLLGQIAKHEMDRVSFVQAGAGRAHRGRPASPKVTETPSWQSRSMMARPIPLAPPVTIATCLGGRATVEPSSEECPLKGARTGANTSENRFHIIKVGLLSRRQASL